MPVPAPGSDGAPEPPAAGFPAAPGTARPVAAAVLGLAGSVLVAAGGRSAHPLTTAADRPSAAVAAVALGLVLLVAGWLRLLHPFRDGRAARPGARTVGLLAALWALPLLLAPPLFSRDAQSYVAQGEMVARGLDPYVHGPVALGPGEHLDRVDPLWRKTPAPYGPGWLTVAGLAARAGDGDPERTLLGLRAAALAGTLLLAGATVLLARRAGGDPAYALAAGIANPLVLLHLVSGAHNESLLVGLAAASAVAAVARRPVAAVLLGGLAAAVKAPGFLALGFAGWHLAGERASRPRRAASAAAAGLAGVGLVQAVAAASGLGWGWLGALGTPGRIRSPLAPAAIPALLLRSVRAPGWQAVLAVGRVVALVVLLAVVAHLLWHAERLGLPRALGLALSATALLAPTVHPWYVLWGVPLLAAVPEARRYAALVVGCAAFGFVVRPQGGVVLNGWGPVGPYGVAAAGLLAAHLVAGADRVAARALAAARR